jgi:hypothetical protein
LQDLLVDGGGGNIRIILKKYSMRVWAGLIRIRIGLSGRPCEHGSDHSVSIKDGVFLDYVSDC